VEEILGMPVLKTFPNEYQAVNEALTAGTCLDPLSEIGKSFAQFAEELVEKRGAARQGKRKFLEYFALPQRSLVPNK
ncbi:MAG: hypothetical protein ACRD30_08530, partial [Bryobacteraceae bacterium]